MKKNLDQTESIEHNMQFEKGVSCEWVGNDELILLEFAVRSRGREVIPFPISGQLSQERQMRGRTDDPDYIGLVLFVCLKFLLLKVTPLGDNKENEPTFTIRQISFFSFFSNWGSSEAGSRYPLRNTPLHN